MSRVLPILFNTEMVRAILDGRKTVTRRVVNPQPKMILCYFFAGYGHGKWHYPDKNAWEYWGEKFKRPDNIENDELKRSWTPPCHTDDILYVRETWFYEHHMEDKTAGEPDLPSGRYSHRYIYKADEPDYPVNIGVGATGWRPSIHMPKEAARIWLKVADVRAERLQDIGVLDCQREGIDINRNGIFKRFSMLWDSTIRKSDLDRYGWGANPWVWVIEFERCEKPEGELCKEGN